MTVLGEGNSTLLLAHGFGCDQRVWQFLVPLLKGDYKIVLFDYAGSGKSDITQFDPQKYSTLEGYAEDILAICDALSLKDVTLIGHSVSSIIGLLATIKRPEYFTKLIMVCPCPCFLNSPPDYYGGFDKADLQELISLMDKNYIGWAQYLAPLVMGVANSSELIAELTDKFCSTDPVIAKNFANATFFSDHRATLPKARHPVLILQSEDDALAAKSIGEYMHNALPNSSVKVIPAQGHCLHMSHPQMIAPLIVEYINA